MRRFTTLYLLPALLLTVAAGCDDTLTVEPQDEVREESAIVDATSARAAQAGMYDALSSNSYYGEDFLSFGDLTADDVLHTGTFTDYALADRYDLRADNGTIAAIWNQIYEAIGTNNQVLVRVASIRGLDSAEVEGEGWVQVEKNQILGEAHFLRALNYHNLVKTWGDVPLVLEPPGSVGEAAQVTRSPASQVYTQILADLAAAEALMSVDQTRKGSLGAVFAVRSRVFLHQQNWAGAEAAAETVVNLGYELATNYPDLFTAEGQDTPEDIFRIAFTAQEFTNLPYYYLSGLVGGRREIAPTSAHAAAYEAGDRRRAWSISFDARGRRYGSKYPDAEGAEDLHVIRFAEVLLNKAEAEAQQGKLTEAVASYNLVRARAGLAQHVLGVNVVTQQDVLNAIYKERRFELAMEGFRWPDLVRLGLATQVLGIPAFRTLFPLPQRELDVAPNLTQNPGY
jgi:starch-binding outer membrane protein, SusD/RagB family